MYTILGVNLEGRKEVLGLFVSEYEGANFWLRGGAPSVLEADQG